MNTDYALDNGMTLRYHGGDTEIWIELLDQSRKSMGKLARLRNPRQGDKSNEIAVRALIYDEA